MLNADLLNTTAFIIFSAKLAQFINRKTAAITDTRLTSLSIHKYSRFTSDKIDKGAVLVGRCSRFAERQYLNIEWYIGIG